MSKKRKTVTMLVTVTAPPTAKVDEVRGVVRLAIANGIELQPAHSGGVKVKSVRSATSTLAAAAKAELAWGKPHYPKPSPKAKTPPLLAAMGGN